MMVELRLRLRWQVSWPGLDCLDLRRYLDLVSLVFLAVLVYHMVLRALANRELQCKTKG